MLDAMKHISGDISGVETGKQAKDIFGAIMKNKRWRKIRKLRIETKKSELGGGSRQR